MKIALIFFLALVMCQGQGIITTVAGTGALSFSGDGGLATSATLRLPTSIAVGSDGSVYIADTSNSRVRKVDPGGIISTFAGNGTNGDTGDGGQATSATLFFPTLVGLDKDGNVYIADNQRIRKVDSRGIITLVAGGAFNIQDNIPAAQAEVGATGMYVDSSGAIYISDDTILGGTIRKIDTAGIITTLAGLGGRGFGGDGGPARDAKLNAASGVTLDSSGNIYFMDGGNNRIRKINQQGIINTIAGNGTRGFSGDGGQATSAQLNLPVAIEFAGNMAVDSLGNIYFPDVNNNRIRKIDTNGIITTVAGGGLGVPPFGDGGPATQASLSGPAGIAFDAANNLYIADSKHNKVRKVTAPASAPAVSGAVNGASFQPPVVTNSWATIAGTNISPLSDTWANAIVNGRLPTTLDGVSVTVGSQPAYIYFINGTQINLIVPDVAPGPQPVVVKNAAGSSAAFNATVSQFGPAFFPWPGNQPVATRQDFTLAVKDGTFPGATTLAAKPGEVIILWGTGFGPTTPPAPAGVQVPSDQTYSTSSLPAVTVNNAPAIVYGAALAPGLAGVYQVAIQIPPSLADGDWPIQASIGGVPSPSSMVISVKK